MTIPLTKENDHAARPDDVSIPLPRLRPPDTRPVDRTRRDQVRETTVGITTTCPYENAIEGGCWSGAYWALIQLDGVKAVDKAGNGYTNTARVYLKEQAFPDPEGWASKFKGFVGQTYIFRGVELTADGLVSGDDKGLTLQIPGVDRPIALRRFEHKLQWNSKKHAPRQPEPDELSAYEQLASKVKNANGERLKMQVTGPLTKSDTGYTLEVREFFPQTQGMYAPAQNRARRAIIRRASNSRERRPASTRPSRRRRRLRWRPSLPQSAFQGLAFHRAWVRSAGESTRSSCVRLRRGPVAVRTETSWRCEFLVDQATRSQGQSWSVALASSTSHRRPVVAP